mgnify:CR=1 FL=1
MAKKTKNARAKPLKKPNIGVMVAVMVPTKGTKKGKIKPNK